MADLKCNTCSEPWDWFYIRDEVLADQPLYEKMKDHGGYVNDSDTDDGIPVEVILEPNKNYCDAFADWNFIPGPYIQACPACFGKAIEPDDNAKIRAALQDMLGDDIDGFISEMEDFGL